MTTTTPTTTMSRATTSAREPSAPEELPRPGTILVVEDDRALATSFALALRKRGLDVRVEHDGTRVVELVRTLRPDVVLLDVGLPGIDGLDVLRAIRDASDVPVLLVTGRSDEVDRVVGFELGADDYVVKPVFTTELVARVRAHLRRAHPPTAELTDFGGFRIDRRAKVATSDGMGIELTAREFGLLAHLAAYPHRTFTRRQLLEAVWKSAPEWQDARTVTEHVRRVRGKLRDAGVHTIAIETVRGSGYRLTPLD